MNHLTDLQCSMYVDGALIDEARNLVSAHAVECEACKTRLQAFRQERQIIADTILQPDSVSIPETMPNFSNPLSLRNFALANVATGLTLWIVQFLWKTVFGELFIAGLTQLTSMYLPGAWELATDAALYFLEEGTIMIETYLGLVISALVLLTLALVAIRAKRHRLLVSFSVMLLAGSTFMISPNASAIEIRRGEAVVSIPEDERIDDTLLIGGETIVVDGDVTGDLFVAGRRIVINGTIGGNVVAFGDSVSITGTVGGLLLGAASSIELDDARVDGDLWGAGDQVTVGRSANVQGNATMASGLATIEGSVGRDLVTFAERVNISGNVGNDLEAFAEQVNLLGNGRIEGDVRFRTKNEDSFQQSGASSVGGTIEFVGLPENWEPRNRYVSTRFYLWQAVRFVAALLAGVALLWLIPSLRDLRLDGGVDGLKTAGIGLISLIMLPIAMVLFAVTVVGLPFTLVLLSVWALLLYFAKIIVASMIGQMALVPDADQFVLPLVVGLAIVIVSVNLPAIGGGIGFVLTIIGMGMLTRELYLTLESRPGR